MNRFARIALLAVAFAGIVFTACTKENTASIVCGREWNPVNQVVADTTSEFELANPMIVQFRYGTGFDFTSLKMSFYEGTSNNKGKEIWKHEAKVSGKADVYTLQGHSKRGGLMTAGELTRYKKAGPILIEVTTDGKLLAAKEITLVKNKP